MRVDHGKVIGMVSIPSDRRDEDIVEMGRLSAGIFDYIVFREGPDGRGRPTGVVTAPMYKGALEAGASPDRLRQVIIEKERSEERREGTESVRTCSSWWSPFQYKH